eukprot:s1031_g4.t3
MVMEVAPLLNADALWHKAAIVRCMRFLQVPATREKMDESERKQVDDSLDPPTSLIIAAAGVYAGTYASFRRVLRARPLLLQLVACTPPAVTLCMGGLFISQRLLKDLMKQNANLSNSSALCADPLGKRHGQRIPEQCGTKVINPGVTTSLQKACMSEPLDVVLPKKDFTYVAGKTDRPWEHFTGRWEAIKPILAEMLAASSKTRPLRIVDLGSCNGFFALKAAYRHPEADVVAIEGSVGIGNGTAGLQGTVRQILRTEAVQTHLRWIQKLELTNCFVAPEVWDYKYICGLASGRPICDAMFLLSVIHHIDNISAQQYMQAGLSRAQGGIDLIAKLLLLSPRHFVELPYQPWLKALFDTYGTAKNILEAAAKASGLQWGFRGKLRCVACFGRHATLGKRKTDQMPELDIEFCPFPLLYRGNELDSEPDIRNDTLLSHVDGWNFPGDDNLPLALELDGDIDDAAILPMAGYLSDPSLGAVSACENISGTLLQPAIYAMQDTGPLPPERSDVALALKAAPTALLLAHLTLREAIAEAEDLQKRSKRRAPCGPKPEVPRPRPLRSRVQHGPHEDLKIGKVVKAEELSNLVVNDLIKEALAADARIVPAVPADEIGNEIEDDVLSLSGQSETEEEEMESVDLASRIASRVVQQGIQLDVAKAVQDASQEISVQDFEEVEGFSEDEESFEEVDNTAIVPQQESFDEEMAARLEARQTLIQAAQSGKLLAALQAATAAKTAKVEEVEEVDTKQADVESLRREARDTLLKAARDGRLASAFKEMRKVEEVEEVDTKQADVESLRREARDTLLKAARDGRLASAFRQVKEADEIETLRQQARDALLEATADGRLTAALLQSKVDKPKSIETASAETEDSIVAEPMEPAEPKEPSLEDAREKARSALLNTLRTGDFQKAMQEIVEKRQTQALSSAEQPTQATEVPPSAETAVEWHEPLQESAVFKTPGRTKRRIIGGVVRAPSEAVPVDPLPPPATSKLAWFMAGPVSNGLRQKDVATFQMDDGLDTENRGLTRKSSLTSMFEALGSAQLIHMDADDEHTHQVTSMRLSSSCTNLKPQGLKPGMTSSASAMALDLGLDLGAKDRIGTPSMGSRCSSVGSLRALKANKAKPLPFLQKPSSRADWSISNASVMKTTKEWSTMGTMAAF